jgi:hypothetical protein
MSNREKMGATGIASMLRYSQPTRPTRVYRKSVGGTGAELVEAPPFDKLRGRSSPTVLRYTRPTPAV